MSSILAYLKLQINKVKKNENKNTKPAVEVVKKQSGLLDKIK